MNILKNGVDVVVCRNRQKLYKQYTNIYKPYTYQQITHALYHCHSPWLESHCTRCPATGMSIKNRTKKEERGECKTTTYRTKRTTKMTQKNYRKLQKLHQILNTPLVKIRFLPCIGPSVYNVHPLNPPSSNLKGDVKKK